MIDPTAQKLIDLMFDKGERVCVSPNKFAYVAVDPSELKSDLVRLTQNDGARSREYATHTLSMLCLNPVLGSREDQHVTVFRSFLVEIDNMPIKDQLTYVKNTGMPYSAIVFSGNKSLHFVITLKEPIKSIDEYKFYGKWILAVVSEADQATFPPTRCVRMPGVVRTETGNKQLLVELKDRVDNKVLFDWLDQFEHKKPTLEETLPRIRLSEPCGVGSLPRWVQNALIEGPNIVGGSRNKTWFGLACELGKHGYEAEDAIDLLSDVFSPDPDFGISEWKTAIKSGIKHSGSK